MSNTNKKGVIYYLEQIWGSIKALSSTVLSAQSDWNEADATSPKYIANKPNIPTIPTVGTIVAGTVSEGDFTPSVSAPSFSDVLGLVATTPSVVYLNYSSTYDMVVSASASLIKTAAGVEWAAPAGS